MNRAPAVGWLNLTSPLAARKAYANPDRSSRLGQETSAANIINCLRRSSGRRGFSKVAAAATTTANH